ncbi:MAG TPA: hypothetical protein EYQ74_11205 [Planctomycetes bacterium]|nr:hypothetical protein [Planctomycetota bacterium]HIK61191.1 hypothetical protein [Planctomycetota bacterium]
MLNALKNTFLLSLGALALTVPSSGQIPLQPDNLRSGGFYSDAQFSNAPPSLPTFPGSKQGSLETGESAVLEMMEDYPITVIILDDIGHEFLAVAYTPVIDKLASDGVWFRQAWAYPMCSPSRAALMTGRHGFRTGIGSNIKPEQEINGLGLSEITIAELLPEPVELFGKWHLGLRPNSPNVQGFAHYSGCRLNLDYGGGMGYYRFLKTVNGGEGWREAYATTDTTDDALLSTAGIRIVSYHGAHTPIQNPPGFTGGTSQQIAIRIAEHMDREIGRLLADYEGYVILFGDNGSVASMGGQKYSLMEKGIRVPFLVHGPGINPAVSKDLVSVVDIFATLAEMRGVTSHAEDSVSFVPVLLGLPGERETIYSEKFKPNHTLQNHHRVIRDQNLKVYVYPPGNILGVWNMHDGKYIFPPYDELVAANIRKLIRQLPR